MTPLESIKRFCYECSGEYKSEVRLCQLKDCPLHEFRSGKGNRKMILTDIERKRRSEQMKKVVN